MLSCIQPSKIEHILTFLYLPLIFHVSLIVSSGVLPDDKCCLFPHTPLPFYYSTISALSLILKVQIGNLSENGHQSWNFLSCYDKSIWSGNLGSAAPSIDQFHSFVIKYLFSLCAGGHSLVMSTATAMLKIISLNFFTSQFTAHFTSWPAVFHLTGLRQRLKKDMSIVMSVCGTHNYGTQLWLLISPLSSPYSNIYYMMIS